MERREVSLVVGADGALGRALADRLRRDGERVLETTRRPGTVSEGRILLDLASDVSGWLPPCQVSVAYLCAAVTSLERCRKEPAMSAAINVHSVVALARNLVAGGTFIIFPSTNLVYDGSLPFRQADDPMCPLTEYGRQKAEAERQLLGLGHLTSIVRFTKILGPDVHLFKGWLKALRMGEIIHPFSDMVLSPVSLPFAVGVLRRIAEARLPGIVQVSGAEDVTYEQVAKHIARYIEASPDLVQSRKAKEAGLQLEAIPSHTTLDMTRLRLEFGIEPPSVWSAVDSVFDL